MHARAGKAAADKRRRDVLATAGSSGSGSSAAAAAPPKWFVTADELSRVPAYMKGRLTLEKVSRPAKLPPVPVSRPCGSTSPLAAHTTLKTLACQLT
jgi:hypothetical protein